LKLSRTVLYTEKNGLSIKVKIPYVISIEISSDFFVLLKVNERYTKNNV